MNPNGKKGITQRMKNRPRAPCLCFSNISMSFLECFSNTCVFYRKDARLESPRSGRCLLEPFRASPKDMSSHGSVNSLFQNTCSMYKTDLFAGQICVWNKTRRHRIHCHTWGTFELRSLSVRFGSLSVRFGDYFLPPSADLASCSFSQASFAGKKTAQMRNGS